MPLTNWNYSRQIMSADHIKPRRIRPSIKRSRSLTSLLMIPAMKVDDLSDNMELDNQTHRILNSNPTGHKRICDYSLQKHHSDHVKLKTFPVIAVGQLKQIYLDPNTMDDEPCFRKPSPLEQLQKSCETFLKQLNPLGYQAILNDPDLPVETRELEFSTIERLKQPNTELADDLEFSIPIKRPKIRTQSLRHLQTKCDSTSVRADADFCNLFKLASVQTSCHGDVQQRNSTQPISPAPAIKIPSDGSIPTFASTCSNSHSILWCKCSLCARLRLIATLLSSWTTIWPSTPSAVQTQPCDLRVQKQQSPKSESFSQEQQRTSSTSTPMTDVQQPNDGASTSSLLSWSSLVTLMSLANLTLPSPPP